MIDQRRKSISLLLVLVMVFSVIGTGPANPFAETVQAVADTKTGEWDTVYFGRYWQSDTNGDGVADRNDEKQPIRWRILTKSGSYALLLADQNLDAGKFFAGGDAATWETSDLRNWLNTAFYNTAFNDEEKQAITVRTLETKGDEDTWGITTNSTKDKVFALSYEDVCNCSYGFDSYLYNETTNTRTTTNTAYTATKAGMYASTSAADTWWLRNSGMTEEEAYVVFADGAIAAFNNPVNVIAGIRPAIYVDLSDTSLWTAGNPAVAEDLPEEGDVNGSMTDDSGNLPVADRLPDWDADPGTSSKPTNTEIPVTPEPVSTVEPGLNPTANLAHMAFTKRTEGGHKSNNRSAYDYEWNWANTVSSYLEETADGEFQRVEACEDGVYIETYSRDFLLLDAKKIQLELPIFGGYYAGSQYNFLVFGQENPEESDGVEVVRVVKYDKNWNALGTCSISGVNTSIPFRAGSLRMTETGGVLYIHTCHQMYKSSDGVNHQANMTFAVNESTMSAEQKQYTVWNISSGYVSHSFNQFIETDGTYLYRLDHGDANPRSVVLTKCNKSNITSSSNTNVLSICGEKGENATGVCIGGFDLNGDKLITVGNSVSQSDASYDASGQRNVFVAVTDTNLSGTSLKWLTSYEAGEGTELGNPQMIACDGGYFVMWEEREISQSQILTKIIKIDTAGNVVEGACTIYARLSDCQPIVTSEGQLVWYITEESSPVFYQIDTNDLQSCEYNGKANVKDCAVTLSQNTYEYQDKVTSYTPEPTVKYGDYAMVKDKDYTVSYSNNYYPGTATVKIQGTGFFEGTKEVSFEIVRTSATNQPVTSTSPDTTINPGTTARPNNTAKPGSISNSSGSANQNKTNSQTGKKVPSSYAVSKTSSSATIYPTRVKGVKLKNKSKKTIKITWSRAKNSQYYQVQIAKNRRFTKGKRSDICYSRSTYASGVKKKKTYYVRVVPLGIVMENIGMASGAV